MSNKRKLSRGQWDTMGAEMNTFLRDDDARLAALQWLDHNNPGLVDQARAAAEENRIASRRVMERLIHDPGPGRERVVMSKPSRRMQDQVWGQYLELVFGMVSGEVKCCPHIAPPHGNPAIPWVAWPAAKRAECRRCQGPSPVYDEVEDHTCDLCRGYVPGQTIDVIVPRIGPLTMHLGVCRTCGSEMSAEPVDLDKLYAAET